MTDSEGSRPKRLDELEPLVGETRTTVSGLRVEAGKVEEFARAVGDDDPVYRDPDAATARGFPRTPAPLTFTRVGRFPRYGTSESIDLGFRHEYVLHGGHAYEYDRPLVVGDVLRGETTLAAVSEREGKRGGTMTVADVETAYYDRSDERVLKERATVIETDGPVTEPTENDGSVATDERNDPREDSDRDREREPRDDGVSPDARDAREATSPNPVKAGDLDAGASAPAVRIGPLRRRDFVRYAGASGDFNPIHYDEPYAHEAGNPSVFGQGMFTAGVAAHMIGDWFGVGTVKAFAVRFRSRVWPGDTIIATGEVTALDGVGHDESRGDASGRGDASDRGDTERVEADFRVVRGNDEVVLTGQATALLAE